MADLGSLQALSNWIDQFYTANNQQRITGPIGNTGLQNVKDTLAGIIFSQFGQVGPMIADSSNALKGGVPDEGNTLAKLYNLILAVENTDFKDTYAAMTATVYESNKLIVVKNASDGPHVETGAALYFFNNNVFEFLAGYDAINFQSEPAGGDREIQFNNLGTMFSDANLKWSAVLGLLIGEGMPLSLNGGTVQLVPTTVENKSYLVLRIDNKEIGKLSQTSLELYGNDAISYPKIQHPATNNEPMFVSSGDPTTGLGFVYHITEAIWIPAFFIAGVKVFEVHQNYLQLADGTKISTGGNVVEIAPPDNRVKALSLGKANNRFNSIAVLVGDAEDGDAGIIIDYLGISYSADLSGRNANNPNWLTSKKYVDDGDAGVLNSIKGGVPVAGDNLNKLYNFIQAINAILQSDDVTLDQVQEIVNYIKANKVLLDQVTTGKVNVNDIINNLTSDDTNKPLSAAQGKALKALIDSIAIDGMYVHPATHPATMIVEDATHRFVTDGEKNTWNNKQNALGFTPENIANKGQANGYASLDVNSKIPLSQIPDGLGGGLSYQGVWNAAANNPAIPNAAASNKGHYYKVSVPGNTNISNNTDWEIGDWILSNGVSWDKIDQTEKVSSVAGKTGAVTLTKADVNLNAVDNIADINKPVSNPQKAALDLKADADKVVSSINNRTGAVTLSKADVQLNLVDNTPDIQKIVSIPQQAAINAALQGQASMSAIYAFYNFI